MKWSAQQMPPLLLLVGIFMMNCTTGSTGPSSAAQPNPPNSPAGVGFNGNEVRWTIELGPFRSAEDARKAAAAAQSKDAALVFNRGPMGRAGSFLLDVGVFENRW